MSTVLLNSSLGTLNSHQYTYNNGSQRTRQTFTDNNYTDYSYDNIGQLTNADSTLNTENRSYVYDPAWNLTNRSGSAFVVDNKNELTNAPDPVGAITYDSNGNMLSHFAPSSHQYSFVYDDENRLVQFEDDLRRIGGLLLPIQLTQFVYDGLGRLRQRLEYSNSGGESPSPIDPDFPNPPGGTWVLQSETRYIYDGMRVIQERDGSNTPLVSYTRGNDLSGTLEGAGGIGGLLGRSDGYSGGTWTTHNFYHADGNGNITYLVNSSQSSVAAYKCDPFGNLISSSGTLADANVYRFSSKEQHLNSGMYYYGFRFYDPNLQRWINRDPIGEDGGPNLYAFVENSPLDLVDPWGESDENRPPVSCSGPGAVQYGPPALGPQRARAFPSPERLQAFLNPPLPPGTISGVVDLPIGGLGGGASRLGKLLEARHTAQNAVRAAEEVLAGKMPALQKAVQKADANLVDAVLQHGARSAEHREAVAALNELEAEIAGLRQSLREAERNFQRANEATKNCR